MPATRERGRRSAIRNTKADTKATSEPEAETTFHAVRRTIPDYIDYDATFALDCNKGHRSLAYYLIRLAFLTLAPMMFEL
ncbi:hypothetical protein CSOJ01_14252 [Colletotrichum sojae]|uniref:Uncharacterized protein n=1 Tax=Colletotrichum sojae TaxID=2175907 RepID=A0A8H6MK24_9PEZI|nr:hypothetical protein CSOJ01_14252 [Colletotrichum sojae]